MPTLITDHYLVEFDDTDVVDPSDSQKFRS
jgi:hypothetical protein